MTVLKRSEKDVMREIINQIFLSELCFDICKNINEFPKAHLNGRGDDFLPYYYNLNYTKGLISLYSLLLSNDDREITLKNYIKLHKYDYPDCEIDEFIKELEDIKQEFTKSLPTELRHKIAAHIDAEFEHYSFTSGYIVPRLIEEYQEIIKKLKVVFFEFSNRSLSDDPFSKIRESSIKICDDLVKQK